MTPCLRLGASASVAVVFVLGGTGLAGLCTDFGGGLAALRELSRGHEERQRLDRQSRALIDRNKGKERVVGQVLARRLTLLQAAAEFRRLHEETREDADPVCLGWGEDLSDEALCCNVLTWVDGEGADDPRRASVLPALKAEFAAHFHHAPPVAFRTETRVGPPAGGAPADPETIETCSPAAGLARCR